MNTHCFINLLLYNCSNRFKEHHPQNNFWLTGLASCMCQSWTKLKEFFIFFMLTLNLLACGAPSYSSSDELRSYPVRRTENLQDMKLIFKIRGVALKLTGLANISFIILAHLQL